MTAMLVTVLLICMSHCVYSKSYRESSESHDDIVECVFTININSSIYIAKQHFDWEISQLPFTLFEQTVQNIGKMQVQVKSLLDNKVIEPRNKEKFYSSMNISNFNTCSEDRAIVYISDCSDDSKVYIEKPEEGYNKNKVLWGAATLGVKSIPRWPMLSKLISTFWPENEQNVWQQIYEVIKDLLDDETQQIISKILNEDIKDIQNDMVALNETKIDDFDKSYVELFKKLENIETLFTLEDHEIFNFYIIPLYSNVVTLKMYFYALGLISYPRSSKMYKTIICQNVSAQLETSDRYLSSSANKAFDKIYNTGYAGGLYNVMMNARSHFAWHALELIPKWEEVYSRCAYIRKGDERYNILPISHSNLFGRATPDLLELSIYTDKIPFPSNYTRNEGSIETIDIYIKEEKEVQTVFGLELFFMSHLKLGNRTSFAMGECTVHYNMDFIIYKVSLNLTNKSISKLKVYKIESIICLEFSLSDNSTRRFGDHCEDYSENFEFYLEGHYIYSFYMANDYPETGEYFDNVAVWFHPK